MALLDSIFTLNDKAPTKVTALATSTSSTEQNLGRGGLFWLNATQDITIAVGDTGMSAATAANMRVPANSNFQFQMHPKHDFVRVFNLSSTTTADVYILPISRS